MSQAARASASRAKSERAVGHLCRARTSLAPGRARALVLDSPTSGVSTAEVAKVVRPSLVQRRTERARLRQGFPSTSASWTASGSDTGEGWQAQEHHKSRQEVWAALKREAAASADMEPVLASHLHSSIIMHGSLEESLAFVLANKLSSPTLLATNLMQLMLKAFKRDPTLVDSAAADLQAVLDRDPACDGFLQPMLFFKGFQAIQGQRVAHHLWRHGRAGLAHALQSRIAQQFDVDVHPGAYLGRGLMFDHATGIVIGETAVIGDNVTMLHRVTIGGSGVDTGIRHPTIGHGVLLGAGVCVLGPISVGHSSKIGACSVVVRSVPEKSVAVGVPAKVVKQDKFMEPCREMDSVGDFVLDFAI